eukprot:PITA_12697
MKILRTDNGTEYESNEFSDFWREVGIKRETTFAYTLEQNVVAERNNRTIIEATRAMLHDQGLPKFLWGEAANTAIYVQNRSSHQALDFKTPEEVFTDFSLGKAIDLPIQRKDNDAVVGKQDKSSTDEPVPNVEGTMDPIDPPLGDPSTSKKRPLWLKGTLKDAKRHIAPRGTFHESKKLNRYQGYLAAMSTIVQSEPCTFEKAVKHQAWKDAMNEEYESIMENDVWDVVPRPKDKSVVISKWIYKIKHGGDGNAKNYKAKFVAQGFSQKEGVDYVEIFAPIARYTTIRSIIALVASQGWSLHQMDVKTAFLHGLLREEVYVEQPKGFKVQD